MLSSHRRILKFFWTEAEVAACDNPQNFEGGIAHYFDVSICHCHVTIDFP